jgi:hypothetical protein
MSAADTPENLKLFFPEPTSAMRFFHQHYDKISPKSQRETFFFIIIMDKIQRNKTPQY